MLYLAWRNVWRNPSRTWGIILSIALSVAGLWLLGAMVRGLNGQRLAERLDTSLGHLKITSPLFLQHKPVEAYFLLSDTVKRFLANTKNVLAYTPRLNVRASVWGRQGWVPVDAYGVITEREKQVLKLYEYVKAGRYLAHSAENAPQEVLVGKELAKKINKKVQDTLTVYLPAPLHLKIVGIYDVSSKDFSNSHIFLHEATLRKALQMPTATFHQIILKTTHADIAKSLAHQIKQDLPTHHIRSWQETAPDLAYLHTLTSYFLGVLVFLATIVLGILQYILWQSNWQERLVEWKRLRAWGFTKKELALLWIMELFAMVLLGILVGLFIGSWGLAYLWYAGFDLAYFAEGLAKAGYAQKIFPVVWVKDVLLIVIFFSVFSLLSIAETTRKIWKLNT